MPTYDYQCNNCGHTFEAIQSMRDDPLTDCPECNMSELRRLISGGTGVIFKGSGFYVNDSRKNGSSAKGTRSTAGGSSDEAGPGKTADATTGSDSAASTGANPSKQSA